MPKGQELNLDERFVITWQDEFDGDSLDLTKWKIGPNVQHAHWGYVRKGGYWHPDMVKVESGNLVISTQYFDEPLEDSLTAGYYTGMISTSGLFEQKYGYFETRCILPSATGMWSAFWMMNEGVYQVNGDGRDGTEVDVFESFNYKDEWWGAGDCVSTGIHFDGYGEESQGDSIGKYYVERPYTQYNTYGVEWNEDEFIFYINGIETSRLSKGGVSQNPEFLILSCEVAGNNAVADSDRHGTGKITLTKNWPAEFKVDYVRVYQYK